MGVGAFDLSFHIPEKDAATVSWCSCVNCVFLQNENSLGQDPCQIVSLLEASCRGAGECIQPSDDDPSLF